MKRNFSILTLILSLLLSSCSAPEIKQAEVRNSEEIPSLEKTKTPPQSEEEIVVPVHPLKRLTDFAYNQKHEDPETFSYKGCLINHGTSGSVDLWQSKSSAEINTIYNFLEASKTKNKLILLDYSKNPYGTSDSIQIVSCNCSEYLDLKARKSKTNLDFNNVLWHASDPHNLENEPMAECFLEEYQAGFK